MAFVRFAKCLKFILEKCEFETHSNIFWLWFRYNSGHRREEQLQFDLDSYCWSFFSYLLFFLPFCSGFRLKKNFFHKNQFQIYGGALNGFSWNDTGTGHPVPNVIAEQQFLVERKRLLLLFSHMSFKRFRIFSYFFYASHFGAENTHAINIL